nr:MAG: hypothetical protein AM325_00280 [Candidatus Thorarchaeota archaeon SMTZ1-45]
MMMKISKMDNPLMLRVHLPIDFAAAMIGIRNENMIRSGIIDRNRSDTTASTIDKNSFARGSNL